MPIMAASLGLLRSVIMPMGMPDAYMPRLAAVPWYHCEKRQIFGVGLAVAYDDIALGCRELELIGELRCPC